MNYIDELLIIPALVGLIYLLLGSIMLMFPPKTINKIYGYRTESSMKTQESWSFAQNFASKKMIQVGLFLCCASFIGLVIVPSKKSELILGIGLTTISTIFIFISVETILNKKFGNGK